MSSYAEKWGPSSSPGRDIKNVLRSEMKPNPWTVNLGTVEDAMTMAEKIQDVILAIVESLSIEQQDAIADRLGWIKRGD